MTTIKQDQRAEPAAVELHEDALDRAAGGGGESFSLNFIKITQTAPITPGTGVLKAR